MQTLFSFLLVLCLYPAATFAQQPFDHSHAVWTGILKKYQDAQGLVRYKELKADAAKAPNHEFSRYLASLQKVTAKEFQSWTKEQQMAFLINAYNAFTFKLIVDNYPVASIKKIGGLFTKPWSIEFFSLLDNQIKALDPIEHKWLRPKYKDYRIHAAVNCASISCPPLRNEAFVGDRLSAQLDEQMQTWLKDASRNKINGSSKNWKVSKIFDWYGDDFEKWGGGVVKVISQYLKLPARASQGVDLDFMDYNWDLNEAK